MRMENLSSTEGSKKDKVINLHASLAKRLKRKLREVFNRRKSLKDRFADNFKFIKIINAFFPSNIFVFISGRAIAVIAEFLSQ